jgi:hypothetical protein
LVRKPAFVPETSPSSPIGPLGIALFEAATVLILRAHYTMDVFTGAVTALLVSQLAAWIAPRCDAALARWGRKRPAHVCA